MAPTYYSRPVTEAIITALTNAALAVGDGEKPEGAGWQGASAESPFIGYVVVHPLGAYEIDGSLGDPFADVWPAYQLTSYGATQHQCEVMSHRVAVAVLTAVLVIAGRSVSLTSPDDGIGQVARVDGVQPPLYMAPDRFTVCTTPA